MAGRPTNRDERYNQVMQALVRCVARFGLDGASLSQIAREAGLTRPLIRHHLGNREDIIAALTDYVLNSFADQTKAMVETLPNERRSAALVELLFSEEAASEPEMVLVFAALTARASDDPELRERCRDAILTFETAIAETLQCDHPAIHRAESDATAHGIAALYFNMTSLAPLDMPTSWQGHARDVAKNLLKQLDRKP